MKIERLYNKIILFKADVLRLNATIIDCGFFYICLDSFLLYKDTEHIAKYIKLSGKPLKYLINTHWHSDHCFGNNCLLKLHQDETINIIAHEQYLNTIINEKNLLNPKKSILVSNENLSKPNIVLNESEINTTFSKSSIYDVKENADIQLYYTPGHTYDSLCIYDSDLNILWSGDTFLSAEKGFFSIPYFYWGDPFKHLKSLRLIESLNPELIISGHGEIIEKHQVNDLLNYQINYLEKIIQLTEDIINDTKLNYETFFDYMKFEKIFHNFNNKKLWIEKMHTLNLEKIFNLYQDKKEKS